MFLEYNLDVEQRSVWKIAHPSADAGAFPFVVNESGVFYAKQAFYTKRNEKNDYQILYTVAGAGEMLYEGQMWRLTEGSLALIDCNRYHAYHTAPDVGEWVYHWAHVGGAFCARFYESLYQRGYRPHAVGVDHELLQAFQQMLEQIDYAGERARCRLSHAVSTIYTRIMTLEDASAAHSSQEAVIRDAAAYIKERYSQPLRLDELARHLNISKYYLIRLFGERIGMTPYRYLLVCRINEAKKMLRATDQKTGAVARAVGFGDESNFCRTFARLTGVTPAKYRDPAS